MLCPKCSSPNSNSAKECDVCGVVFAHAKRDQDAKRSPTLCSWNDHGTPCQCRGIFCAGTNGESSWFCREHWECLQGRRPYGRGNDLPPAKEGPSARVAGLVWDNEAKRYRVAQEAAA